VNPFNSLAVAEEIKDSIDERNLRRCHTLSSLDMVLNCHSWH